MVVVFHQSHHSRDNTCHNQCIGHFVSDAYVHRLELLGDVCIGIGDAESRGHFDNDDVGGGHTFAASSGPSPP